jgi:hypothetical protein
MQVLHRLARPHSEPVPEPHAERLVDLKRGRDVLARDKELQVESHISDHHPDLVGTTTREDLLSMAEEE